MGAMRHLIAGIFVLAARTALAAPAGPPMATLAEVTPLVRAQFPGSKEFRNLAKGATLPEGTLVVTMAQGKAEIRFTDGHFILLSPNSSIELKRLPQPGAERTLLRLAKGAVRALIDRSKKGGDFGIYANTTVTAVKGTDYEVVRDEADDVEVEVNEGRINTGEIKSEDQAEAEAAFKGMIAGMIGSMLSEGQRVRCPHGGRMSKPERMTRPPREPHRREGANAPRERGGRESASRERGGNERTSGTERGGKGGRNAETPASGSENGGRSRGGRDSDRGGKGKGGNNKGPGMPSMPGMGGLGF